MSRNPTMNRRTGIITDRLPPHDDEAEQGIIGCLILSTPAQIHEAIGAPWFPQPGEIYNTRHQWILNAIISMVDVAQPVDLITLRGVLDKRCQLEACGGIGYLNELAGKVPSALNLSYYAEIVREKAILRKLDASSGYISQLVQGGTDNVMDVLDKAEESLLSIRRDCATGEIRRGPALRRALEEILTRRYSGQDDTLPTGFPDIDRVTYGGLRCGEMWAVAARPSAGKTALGLNIATNVARQFLEGWQAHREPGDDDYYGPTVVVFSLEMSAESLLERQVAGIVRINMRQYRTPGPDEKTLRLIREGMDYATSLPLIIDDSPSLSVRDIQARARRYHSKDNTRLFVVDYLQMISTDGTRGADRRVEVDFISRGIKAMARTLKVPVLILTQLNRELDKDKGRHPRMSDIRESGQIEQDADVLAFLYEQDPTKSGDPIREIQFRIGKQRNGPKDIEIPLVFHSELTKFDSKARSLP